MKKAAKLVLIDNDDKYLLMYHTDHPIFGADADLPGGTLDEGESALAGVIREVQEETGVVIEQAKEVYSGLEYSVNGIHFSLRHKVI